MEKERITKSFNNAFWDYIYKLKSESKIKKEIPSKKLLKPIFKKNEQLKENYSNYLFWKIIKKHLPNDKNLKILEVGSAPGCNLLKMRDIFGYRPYGVELSEKGFLLNRRVFQENGLPLENVISADFLSSSFQDKYSNFFDICFSLGFIEHFDNPSIVIDRHINVIKEGGYIIVMIPNFKGLNYHLLRFFNPAHIAMHNLSIMDKRVFNNLFNPKKLHTLECRYYGGFNFALFYAEQGSFRKIILKRIAKRWFHPMLNFIFFKMEKFNINIEHKFFSPYIIYIGRKINTYDIKEQPKI